MTDDEYIEVLNDNGDKVYITRELMKRLTEESETWHWRPWLRTKTEVVGNIIQEVERSSGDSVDSFPEGIFDGTSYITMITKLHYNYDINIYFEVCIYIIILINMKANRGAVVPASVNAIGCGFEPHSRK